MSGKNNGLMQSCGWANGLSHEHVEETRLMADKIETLAENCQHLQRLEKLDVLADSIKELKDGLLEVITGKNYISIDTAKAVFSMSNQQHNNTHKTLSIVAIGLLSVILFLLLGENFGWIRQLFNPIG